MTNKSQGMTVLELTVVLAIVAVLAAVVPPALTTWIYRQEARSNAYSIIRLIHYTRTQAVTVGSPVIICGSNTVSACTHNWNHGTLIFVDKNKNNTVDPTDTVLRQQAPLANGGHLNWRAAFGNRFFRALPNGRISFVGSFTYCPANRDPHFASHIIVNIAGRPRIAQDSNNDGIAETARGTPVNCDS